MRRVTGFVAVALVVAACGGTAGTEPTSAETTVGVVTTTTTPGPTTTVTPGTTTPGAATTTSRLPPDGQAAPDFALALGEGGEFTLSDEQKPVYMVFWAEW